MQMAKLDHRRHNSETTLQRMNSPITDLPISDDNMKANLFLRQRRARLELGRMFDDRHVTSRRHTSGGDRLQNFAERAFQNTAVLGYCSERRRLRADISRWRVYAALIVRPPPV